MGDLNNISAGLDYPTGLCEPGYYCPGEEYIDTATPAQFNCTVGHFCVRGSVAPTPCPPGQYTAQIGQFECDHCPAGSYCIGTTDPTPIICPSGHYCPQGTQDPIPCPNGTFTYDTDTGLEMVDECRPCLAGSYCR